MYIQITEKCNMTCEHCCMSATTKGDTMDRSVYMASLQLAIRYGEYVTIGGGEPTMHPEFFEYLDKAIELYDCGSLDAAPFLVTNGKAKRKALKLLGYIEEGRSVFVELSQDSFHDPIDPEVVRIYKAHERRKHQTHYSFSGGGREGGAGIRTVNWIVPVGRAKETEVYTAPMYRGATECCCEDPLVDPKGMVWSCGCKHTQLGMVWDSDVLGGYDREFAHFGGKNPEPECVDDLKGEGLPMLEICDRIAA